MNLFTSPRLVASLWTRALSFWVLVFGFISSGWSTLSALSVPLSHNVNFTIANSSTVVVNSTWVDTSDPEYGFEIGYSINNISAPTTSLGEIVGSNISSAQFELGSTFTTPGNAAYFFVRGVSAATTALNPNPTKTAWSNVSGFFWPNTASTNFSAPTNLVLTNLGEYTVRISFTDNSNCEWGYEVHVRDSGAPTFTNLGDLGFNTTSVTLNRFTSPQDVKIRCFRVVSSARVYTDDLQQLNFSVQGLNGPTGLTQSTSTPEQVVLNWTDNSSFEGNYEIQYRFGNTAAFQNLSYVNANVTTYTVSGVPPELTQFRVRATRGAGPDQFSPFSSDVSATTTLKAPTGLSVTALGEQTVKLDWTDNSAVEQGYIVQARFFVNGSPSGAFFDIGTTAANAQTLTVNAPNLPYPGIAYEFRVLAGYDPDGSGSAPLILSNPSNAVSATLAFNVPSSFTATVVNETSVNFAWTDNSSVETKYSVLARRAGTTTWGLLADTAANATSHSTTLLFPGTAYEFAVIGVFVRSANDLVESNLSNIVQINTPFTAPTAPLLQPGSLTETQAVLTWIDNSTAEGGYEILARQAGSSNPPTPVNAVAANTTSASVSLTPGASLEYFVRGFFVRTSTQGDVALTSNSPGLIITARDGVTSPLYVEIVKDAPMSTYTLTQSTSSTLSSRSVTDLPAGLTFDSNAGTVTGTPTIAGVTQSNVTLTFANGWTHNNKLVFRVLSPPVVSSFSPQTLTLGTPETVSLIGKFTDPDATSAARVNTNLTVNGGNMDFILFDAATPLHVANFMGYANRGDYVNTVFHRTIPGFITQGGAFRADTAPTAFLAVPTQAQVTNEPGISNVRGTVALAKLPSGPSTGTNQFFVNLANNGPNLDFQNGGFTAFGRVTAPGMAVADAMAALPTGDYNVTIGGNTNVFDDFPFNAASAPATMNNTQAVKINSVTALPVLRYTLVSNSAPTMATASITGNNLSLTPIGLGSTVLVVRATDLDGLTVDHSVTITVDGVFAVTVTPYDYGLNLSWPVVQNADRYDIFRRTNGGALTWVGQSLVGSFSDTSVVPMSSSSYVVRAQIGNTSLDSTESSAVVWQGTPIPEIAVYEGIGTSGPERQDNAGLFSFPNTMVGVSSAARTLTIKNTGPGTLTGLSLIKDGDQSADYTLGNLGATTLASNESTSFTVTFTPSGEGTRRANLRIGSNDGDENPFDVSLSGIGFVERVPTLAEQYATQANETYAYFASLGDQRSALAYWFYFRAFSDQARHTSGGNVALANKEFYQGLAYFYYTILEGEVGRLYFYYLYLGYAELTYRTALGDTAGANAYFTYYYTLALYFAGV